MVSKPVEPAARPRVAPLSAGRYETRFTIGQETYDALRRAEELLGRKLGTEDLDEALARGLKAMVAEFEKRRFAATDRPRRPRRPARGRRVSAAVMREVAQRDARRCTYVSPDGRRCEARARLEYDHIDPVARGIDSTAGNVRLLCRAHNQYMAEQVFGAGFMGEKRERARRAAAARRARTSAAPREEQRAAPGSVPSVTGPCIVHEDQVRSSERGAATRSLERTAASAGCERTEAEQHPEDSTASQCHERTFPARTRDDEIIPCLRRLGFRADEARCAADHCARLPEATLEQRVRAALSFLAPRARVSRAQRCAVGPA